MDVHHDPVRHRFSTTVEGHECVVDYRLAGDVMTITYTGVPPAVGGRGIAAGLVQAALVHAREHRWRVVPACSYAAAYMKRHPEFESLRA